ncbi:MAG: hypothetical protein P4L87_25090 [Formivibrio sp.]|nr:hypothetical protein [Formivibrio sp.]
MTEEVRDYLRSHYEAVGDVRYHARLHYLHAAFYRRIRMVMATISLMSGTASFASVVGNYPLIASVAGVVIAVIAVLDAVSGLPDKVFSHQSLYKRFTELAGRAAKLEMDAIDAESAAIEADETGEIESLRLRAYNDSVLSAGRPDYVVPVSFLAKLLSLIV